MKYGIMLPSREPLARPDSLSAIAQRAEELGYHVMMFPDHIVLPRQTGSQYPYSESGVFPGTDNNDLGLDEDCNEELVAGLWAGVKTREKVIAGLLGATTIIFFIDEEAEERAASAIQP